MPAILVEQFHVIAAVEFEAEARQRAEHVPPEVIRGQGVPGLDPHRRLIRSALPMQQDPIPFHPGDGALCVVDIHAVSASTVNRCSEQGDKGGEEQRQEDGSTGAAGQVSVAEATDDRDLLYFFAAIGTRLHDPRLPDHESVVRPTWRLGRIGAPDSALRPSALRFQTHGEGDVFAKPRLVILACLTALLPISVVAQTPPAPATLGPAVIVLHITGRVPQQDGSVALALARGSRLVVAATDIDAALTRSANGTVSDKQAGGRATRRAPVVVIHITARLSDPDGSIAVLLVSGSRIVLAATHVDTELTRSINDRISVEEARGGPPANQPQRVPGPEPIVFPPAASDQPASPVIGDADTGRSGRALPPAVTAQCTRRWQDFALQEYCLGEQLEGAKALDRRSRVTVTAPKGRRECAQKWPDDLAMRDYCERTQVESAWWIGAPWWK